MYENDFTKYLGAGTAGPEFRPHSRQEKSSAGQESPSQILFENGIVVLASMRVLSTYTGIDERSEERRNKVLPGGWPVGVSGHKYTRKRPKSSN